MLCCAPCDRFNALSGFSRLEVQKRCKNAAHVNSGEPTLSHLRQLASGEMLVFQLPFRGQKGEATPSHPSSEAGI